MLKLFCCLLMLSAPCLPQNPYLRESIGQPDSDVKKRPSYYTAPRVELSSWVGKTFIFLPRDKSARSRPYEQVVRKSTFDYLGELNLLNLSPTNPVEFWESSERRFLKKLQEEFTTGVPYYELVGRPVTVTNVTSSAFTLLTSRFPDRLKFVFLVRGDGAVYVAIAIDELVPGLSLLSDIDVRRENWRGLTVHPKGDELQTYSADTGEYGSVRVLRTDILTVTDVVASFEPCAPARVVLTTTTGQEGFQDVTVSRSNCRPQAAFLTFTDRFEVVEVAGAGR